MFVPRVHISNSSSKLCALLGGVFGLSSCECSALFFPAERAQARYHCHTLLSVSRYIKLQGLVCEYMIFAFLLTHLQHFYHAVCKCEKDRAGFCSLFLQKVILQGILWKMKVMCCTAVDMFRSFYNIWEKTGYSGCCRANEGLSG